MVVVRSGTQTLESASLGNSSMPEGTANNGSSRTKLTELFRMGGKYLAKKGGIRGLNLFGRTCCCRRMGWEVAKGNER